MATTSLAKNAGVLDNVLDKYKEQLLAPVTSEMSEGTGVDYVGFADAKSKNLEALIAAGVPIGSAYVRTNGKFHPLPTLEFHLLSATQLWVNFDQTGAVVGVTNKDPRTWSSPFKENIETAVLVYTPVGVVPAKATFRTTKAQPARLGHKELEYASGKTPDGQKPWGQIDKAHAAVAGAFQLPGLRFFVSTTINKGTSKGKGLQQYIANGKIVLTTPEKSKELEAFFTSDEAKERLAAVMESYTARVTELRSKIK